MSHSKRIISHEEKLQIYALICAGRSNQIIEGKFKISMRQVAALRAWLTMRGTSMQSVATVLLNEGVAGQTVASIGRRSGTVRKLCLSKHGQSCGVCELDFGEVFGDVFEGLIEVHHQKPMSLGKRQTNPEKDCVPICPNCHTMAHYQMPKGKCRSIAVLRRLRRRLG
jgi:predicted HNH restriction endonuclease